MTYEELLAEVRELRLMRDQAEARMMLRLVEIETNHMNVLREAGCNAFGWFVKECGTEPARYESFKVGLEKVGPEESEAIGCEATIVAGQLRSAPEKYTSAVHDWTSEHGGALPTRQTAKRLLMQVDPREETPMAVRRVAKREDELNKLRAENKRLKAENRSLKAKLRKLETAKPKATEARAN